MNATATIKRLALGGLTALTAVAMIAPAGVSAKDGDIIRVGNCSNRSTPRSGQAWRVKLWQDGVPFFNARPARLRQTAGLRWIARRPRRCADRHPYQVATSSGADRY